MTKILGGSKENLKLGLVMSPYVTIKLFLIILLLICIDCNSQSQHSTQLSDGTPQKN